VETGRSYAREAGCERGTGGVEDGQVSLVAALAVRRGW